MSRQFNASLVAYANLQNFDKKQQEQKQPQKKTGGLLAYNRNKPTSSFNEDLAQPMIRVSKHVQTIRDRRMNKNGS